MDTAPEPSTEPTPDRQAATGAAPSDDDPGARDDPPGEVTDTFDDPSGEETDDAFEGRDPLRFNRWMKRSATGAVMTGISLGLREALEQNKNEPALMIEASGQPDDPDHPIELHFDPDNPADTVAVIRRPKGPASDRPEPGQPDR